MRKNLDYYMSLKYPVEIEKIPEEEGGGYHVCIPLLGRYAFVGDGDTIEEALAHLEEVKRDLFSLYLARGIPIPEPDEEEAEYSGKFLLRIPSELHRYLAQQAKRNNTTLNQYCLFLLTRKAYLHTVQEEMEEIRREIRGLHQRLQEISFKVAKPKSTNGNATRVFHLDEYKRSA